MKLIIANWKSNQDRDEIEAWMDKFEANAKVGIETRVVLCPPMPSLMFISNRLLDRKKHPHTYLGVQDISPFPAGRYTGAVSGQNLKGFNVKYAIVGHSERRRYFKETHQDVANKVAQCVEHQITPIVCVDDEYISQQAAAIESDYVAKCVVAYEELGAIGTGHNTPVEHVTKVFEVIKAQFGQVPVIYGGSVDRDNVEPYLEICDGVLVGTASLDVDHFLELIP